MIIDLDASGEFETSAVEYRSTVVAAAVASGGAFREIGAWIETALERWGISERCDELHAEQLHEPERLEVLEMLAARDDVRLSAVFTDPLLLRSREVIA